MQKSDNSASGKLKQPSKKRSSLEIDLEKVALEKIEVNESKYPVDKFKGSSKKYNQ